MSATGSLCEARPHFFGCVGQPGHMLFNERLRGVSNRGLTVPWSSGELDGTLCPPEDKRNAHRAPWPESDELRQPQGSALLHHKDGWTALAFWDRTGDSRLNSNSVFIIPGTLDFDQTLAEARKTYPSLFERFAFEIRLADAAAVSR